VTIVDRFFGGDVVDPCRHLTNTSCMVADHRCSTDLHGGCCGARATVSTAIHSKYAPMSMRSYTPFYGVGSFAAIAGPCIPANPPNTSIVRSVTTEYSRNRSWLPESTSLSVGVIATGRHYGEVHPAHAVLFQWLEGDIQRALTERRGGLARDLAGILLYARELYMECGGTRSPCRLSATGSITFGVCRE
jgi:hypothetical protein